MHTHMCLHTDLWAESCNPLETSVGEYEAYLAFKNKSVTRAISVIQAARDIVAINYKSLLSVQVSSCLYIDMWC